MNLLKCPFCKKRILIILDEAAMEIAIISHSKNCKKSNKVDSIYNILTTNLDHFLLNQMQSKEELIK